MIVGVGTDIIEIDRIEKVGVERLASRILTNRERHDLPVASFLRYVEFVAGRFVAKEAISKAFGTGIGSMFSFQDIEIVRDENGKPIAPTSEKIKDLYGHVIIHCSISHSKCFASAVAVIEKNRT